MTKDKLSAILSYLCTPWTVTVQQFDFIPVCLHTIVRFCETNKCYCHCLGVVSITSLHFCAHICKKQANCFNNSLSGPTSKYQLSYDVLLFDIFIYLLFYLFIVYSFIYYYLLACLRTYLFFIYLLFYFLTFIYLTMYIFFGLLKEDWGILTVCLWSVTPRLLSFFNTQMVMKGLTSVCELDFYHRISGIKLKIIAHEF